MTRDPEEETREKRKRRMRKDKKNPKPLRRKQAAEDSDVSSSDKEDAHAEEALAVSVSHLGAKAATKKGKPGSEALDNSLFAFASLSSSAEAKDSLEGQANSPPSHEDGGNLSDDSEEVTPISRPLSPSQYFGSLMKHSGSREKLLAQAATEPAKNSGSLSLSLSPTLPLQQGSTTDKEEETDSDVDRWVRNQQRLRPPPTDETGKPAGSPKTPAGSSSSSSFGSVDKQATARQVAAELIRHGDLSPSSSLVSIGKHG
jgi:hypothetical protein